VSHRTSIAWTVLSLALSPCAFAAERIHGLGLGLNSASSEDVTFKGFSAIGKIGLTEHWGVLVSFRFMKDDEDLSLGEEDSYEQIGLHAVYMWRPEKAARPHVKFGLARTGAKIRIPAVGSIRDDGLGWSVGYGLEAGSQKVAFFGDLEFARVKLFDENFEFRDVTIGIVFKF
jgi:hypothetical protein